MCIRDRIETKHYYWSEKTIHEIVEIEDEKLVFEHLLYAHFQKRTIEFPEFKGFDSFYVVPNKLIIVDSLSSNEIRDYARNEFKCVY